MSDQPTEAEMAALLREMAQGDFEADSRKERDGSVRLTLWLPKEVIRRFIAAHYDLKVEPATEKRAAMGQAALPMALEGR